MEREVRRIPDYLLERAAAGDLPGEGLDTLADPLDVRERLAALARDDAATLARLPASEFAARVVARAGPPRTPHRRMLLPAAAFAAAALAWVVVPRPDPSRAGAELPDVTRAKGLAPHLIVHRATGSGVEELVPGASARAGDLLQLGYVAADTRFGVILSIDGRGNVTRHWPEAGPDAGALTAQREVLLPEAFRLDDAPGFERFFLVTADAPFPVERALRAARALVARPDARSAPLLLDGRPAASTLIRKEAR